MLYKVDARGVFLNRLRKNLILVYMQIDIEKKKSLVV